MTTPAHPQQQCETCQQSRFNEEDWKIYEGNRKQELYGCFCRFLNREIKLREDGGWENDIISVGCASHSSVQSRDQVLDEVIIFLKSKQVLSPLTETYYGAAIKEIDTELRTQGSRDP